QPHSRFPQPRRKDQPDIEGIETPVQRGHQWQSRGRKDQPDIEGIETLMDVPPGDLPTSQTSQSPARHRGHRNWFGVAVHEADIDDRRKDQPDIEGIETLMIRAYRSKLQDVSQRP